MAVPFKILVFTPVWGRHSIVKIWHEGVRRLNRYWPEKFEFIPFCVASTPDDVQLCEDLGVKYTTAENRPLGRKHNIGLEATKDIEYDYIMQLGSDDIAKDDYLHYVLYAIVQDWDVFGVETLIFWDTRIKEGKIFTISNGKNKVIGAGRCISKQAIEDCKYRLWNDTVEHGLDWISQERLRSKGYDTQRIITSDPVIVDFKSDTNIWDYKKFDGQSCNFAEMAEGLSPGEKRAIDEVT